MSALSPTAHPHRSLSLILAILLSLVLAATIPATEFCTTVESLNVATAMELRRGDAGSTWLHPTLDGEPRVRKPPLTTWITAAAIRPASLQKASSPDAPTRAEGFKELLWEARLPSVLTTLLALLAVAHTASLLLGRTRGLWTLLILGTTALLIAHARVAILDVQLLLWTALANLCLTRILFPPSPRDAFEDSSRFSRNPRGTVPSARTTTPALLVLSAATGIALGLGLLTKGPVALVVTVAPFLAFLALTGRLRRTTPATLLATALGTAIFLLVGGSWFLAVALSSPAAISTWWIDITRSDPSEAVKTAWYSYYRLLPTLFPWSLFFILGAVAAAKTLKARTLSTSDRQKLWLILLWILLPILTMSFFRDRKVRYLVPVVPACAMLAAYGISSLTTNRLGRLLTATHFLFIAAAIAGGAAVISLGKVGQLRTLDGAAPISHLTAVLAGLCAIAACAAAAYLSRTGRTALVASTAALMSLALVIGSHLLSSTEDARSEMRPLAEAIWTHAPDATVYRIPGKRGPNRELSIYLNRVRPAVSTFDDIPASPNPAAVVAFGSPNPAAEQPLPTPPPPWRQIASTKRGEGQYLVLLRPPTPTTPTP